MVRVGVNLKILDLEFVLSLSSCHEKAMVALHFGRIRTRLGVVHFRVFQCFFDFLPPNFLLVRSHQAEIIIVKCLIQGRNNEYLHCYYKIL